MDLSDKISQSFTDKFPLGFIYVSNPNCDYFHVKFGLIGDIKQCSNQIRENDPLHSMLSVSRDNDNITVKLCSGALYVNPPADSYLAMKGLKLPFRKFTVNSEDKLIEKLSDFFSKVKTMVNDNAHDVYGASRIPAEFFV